MAATRRVIEVSVGEEDLAQLETIARSRTAPASWVERARILLAYQSDPSTYAVGEAVGVPIRRSSAALVAPSASV
jgi:hypothetical protein